MEQKVGISGVGIPQSGPSRLLGHMCLWILSDRSRDLSILDMWLCDPSKGKGTRSTQARPVLYLGQGRMKAEVG